MKTFYISKFTRTLLTGNSPLSSASSVILSDDLGKMINSPLIYKVELTDEQFKKSKVNGAPGIFKTQQLRDFKLEMIPFQLSKNIGMFSYVTSYAMPLQFDINSEGILKTIELTNGKGGNALNRNSYPLFQYRLNNNPIRTVSVVSLNYDSEIREFSIRESDDYKAFRNALEDYDDAVITIDNIPTLLEYLYEILRLKSEDWEDSNIIDF